ncbi:hypothetical protein HY643_01625 [Candidatus Woesearchaeota archaeon]|nr:hypothetical protein [Candidatus Woesearchaeota archaeon]
MANKINEQDAGKLFKQYTKKEIKEKSLDFSKKPGIAHVMGNFEEFLEEKLCGYNYEGMQLVTLASQFTKQVLYTKSDVENFCFAMEELTDHPDFKQKTGAYLTALIKGISSPGETFKLNFLSTHTPLNHFGVGLENLTLDIVGDCGSFFGRKSKSLTAYITGNIGTHAYQEAKKSKLKLIGNAGEFSFFCGEECTIEVKGNVGGYAGSNARNTKLSIKGNAGRELGHYSRNCEIKVEGDAGEEVARGADSTKITISGDVLESGLIGEAAINSLIIVRGNSGRSDFSPDISTRIYVGGRKAFPKLRHRMLRKTIDFIDEALLSVIGRRRTPLDF